MSVLSDITSVIGLATKAMELADKVKNLELKTVIVDLKGMLIDLKEEIVELREENARLMEQLKRATAPPEVELKDGMYYKDDDGPFCTACHDSDGKMIRLITPNDPERQFLRIHHKCPSCNALYSN